MNDKIYISTINQNQKPKKTYFVRGFRLKSDVESEVSDLVQVEATQPIKAVGAFIDEVAGDFEYFEVFEGNNLKGRYTAKKIITWEIKRK